jgi:hypothetical protein
MALEHDNLMAAQGERATDRQADDSGAHNQNINIVIHMRMLPQSSRETQPHQCLLVWRITSDKYLRPR